MIVRVDDGAGLFFDVCGPLLEPDGAILRQRPTLLCLHGGPGLDHSMFRPQLDRLARVAQVVYLDFRGHGRSDRGGPEDWCLDRWAEDVRQVSETLGIERPMVLGTSFGGYVAMRYGIRFPDHPSRLILVSTSARGTAHPVRQGHVFAAFERRGGVRARRVVERAFTERTEEAYEEYGRVCGPLYNRSRPASEVLERTVRNPDVLPWFERPGGEGAELDLTPELGAIRCPTLVVGGDDDPITPPEEQRAIVDAMAPGRARLHLFPDAGHGVLRDDPDGLLDAVEEFVTL